MKFEITHEVFHIWTWHWKSTWVRKCTFNRAIKEEKREFSGKKSFFLVLSLNFPPWFSVRQKCIDRLSQKKCTQVIPFLSHTHTHTRRRNELIKLCKQRIFGAVSESPSLCNPQILLLPLWKEYPIGHQTQSDPIGQLHNEQHYLPNIQCVLSILEIISSRLILRNL